MSEIQKLLKKLRKCTDWGMVEAVADALEAAAKRAEATEARLARCVEALEKIGWADPHKGNVIDAMKQMALDALAAAKGGGE